MQLWVALVQSSIFAAKENNIATKNWHVILVKKTYKSFQLCLQLVSKQMLHIST